MGTITLEVACRPLRIGFLVRNDRIDDLVSVARLNTPLLGGIYNPVMPVGRSDDLVDSLIRSYRVDVLYPVDPEDAALQEVHKKYDWLRWPDSLDGPALFEKQGLDDKEGISVLDVLTTVRFYYEREFRHEGAGEYFALPTWTEDDPLGPLWTLLFGEYAGLRGLEKNYLRAFREALKAVPVEIGRDSNVPANMAEKTVPIQLTGHLLYPENRGLFSRGGLYVGRADSFQDLMYFWNLRAAGIDLSFFPASEPDRMHEYLRQHLAHVWESARTLHEVLQHTDIWYSPEWVELEEIRALVAELLPEGARVFYSRTSDVTWTGRGVKPDGHHLGQQSVLANIDERYDGTPILSLALPRTRLTDHLQGKTSLARWAISVEPFWEREYAGLTLRPPDLPELNEWYSRKCAVGLSSARVEPRGLAVLSRALETVVQLRPLSGRDLLVYLFERAGIKATESQPGMIAERMIAQMGRLEGCRIFKVPGVRKLIESREAREGVTRNRATQIIFDKPEDGEATFLRHSQRFVERGERPFVGTHEAFNFLLERGAFRSGLTPVCPNCHLKSWVSSGALGDSLECELCGHRYVLGPCLGRRGDWRYRLSGLFGRDDHQEGAVPVALTLLQLLRLNRDRYAFLYTTALNLEGRGINKCETDLAVLARDTEGRSQVVVGECKARDEITQEDVDKLERVGRTMQAPSLDCYLLFSKTASEFSPSEIGRFKALHTGMGIPPLLFTSRELELDHPYYDPEATGGSGLPHPHPMSVGDVARNSAARYLRD